MESTSVNTSTTAKSHSPFRKWFIRILLLIVLFLGFYIYWMYFNVYSEGSRIGRDLKVSTKGNVFKTCEGYISEGCRDLIGNPPVFVFSVSDEAIEKKLLELQLKPKSCFELKYVEYRRSLPWRGDSHYVITDAIELAVE